MRKRRWLIWASVVLFLLPIGWWLQRSRPPAFPVELTGFESKTTYLGRRGALIPGASNSVFAIDIFFVDAPGELVLRNAKRDKTLVCDMPLPGRADLTGSDGRLITVFPVKLVGRRGTMVFVARYLPSSAWEAGLVSRFPVFERVFYGHADLPTFDWDTFK